MQQQQELTRDDIWGMLSAIDPHDYADWLKIGMALESELGESGFSLFDDWSQTAENYKTSTVRSTWASFSGSGVGIGSLIYMANQNGWRKDAPAPVTPAPASKPAPKPQPSNTGAYAAELWLAADKWMLADNWLSHPSPDESVAAHPYAGAKGITHAGGAVRGIASGKVIGKNADCIIVPIREHGIGGVKAVECINPDGKKQTFGSKSGNYLLLGNTLDKSIPWYVVEGWADGYSAVWHLDNLDGSKRDNCAGAIAFGKANLDKCANQIQEHHNPATITIICDGERSK